MTPSYCRFLLITFWAILASAIAHPTSAQETQGLVSEPITSDSFNHAMKWLNLSWDQRIASEQAHETYKEQWRVLRDGELLDLTQNLREIRTSAWTMPQLKQIEEVLDSRRRIRSRIMAMEKTLFEGLAELATEDQRPLFTRTRLLRERQRYLSALTIGIGANAHHADLVVILEDADDLSPSLRALIEDPLQRYEISVTASLRSLDHETTKMLDTLIEKLRKAGYDESISDPEAAQAMMIEFAQTMEKAAADAKKIAKNIEKIDKRYAGQIRVLLPERQARRFERKYLAGLYPEVYADSGTPEDLIDHAIESDEVTVDEKSRIKAIESTWRGRYDNISRDLMNLRTVQAESFGSDPNFDWQAYFAQSQEFHQQRDKVNEDAHEKITQVLGKERAMHIMERSTDENTEGVMYGQGIPIDAAATATGEVVYQSTGTLVVMQAFDPALPDEILANELNFYLDRIDLDSDLREIVRGFHEAYQVKYRKLLDDRYQQLIGEPLALIGNDGSMNLSAANEAAAGKKILTQDLLDLEQTLFDEIELLLPRDTEDALNALRTARLCEAYDCRAVLNSASERPLIDYADILRSLQLTPRELRAIESTLRQYESDRLPIVRTLHTVFIDQQAAQIKAQNLWAELKPGGDDADYQVIQKRYQAIMQPFEDSQKNAAEQLETLEDWLVGALRELLPPNGLVDFELRYARAMYPGVYPDRGNAEEQLHLARALTDLTDAQLNHLEDLESQHVAHHASLCRNLIECVDATSDPPEFDQNDMAPYHKWEEANERKSIVEFDRTEWNETTRRALRAILTEDQAARIRGLGVDLRRPR